MKYYINYHTGAGNEWVECDLDEAKRIADAGACYTKRTISIEDDAGNEVSRRNWYGCKYDSDMIDEDQHSHDIIDFGNFGFYDNWTE